MYETLFSELRVFDQTIKNRIAFSSPVTGFSNEGQPTIRLMAYYLERAKGGAGLIELEPGLKYQKSQLAEWSCLAEQVHAHGAKLAATLEGELDQSALSVIRSAHFDGVALLTEKGTSYVACCGVGEGAAATTLVDFPEPEECESFLQQGSADMVALSKQLVCDPFWPMKAEFGRDGEIRRYDYLEDEALPGLFRYALNPYLGQEGFFGENSMPPAARPRNIVIIGGGAAGMQAAITASKRGHNVFLLEEGGELGGNLLPQNHSAAEWMVNQLKENLVDVRIGLPVTPAHIMALRPRAVVITMKDRSAKKAMIDTLHHKKIPVVVINDSDCSIGQAIRNGHLVAIGI